MTKNTEFLMLDEQDFEIYSDSGRTIWTAESLLGPLKLDLTAWFQGFPLIGRANYQSPSHVVAPEAFTRHYEIIFVEKGQQVHYLDGERYVLESGDCFLIKPLQKHSTAQRAEARGRFYWWIFSPKEGFLGLDKKRSAILLESLFKSFADPKKNMKIGKNKNAENKNAEKKGVKSIKNKGVKQAVLRLDAPSIKQLKGLLQSLFADWHTAQGNVRIEQILYWEQALLQLFFLILHQREGTEIRSLPGAPRGQREKTQRDTQLYLEKVCQCIALNLRRGIDLEALTELTPYSESHLLRIFREEYGLPLRDYINRERISLAQKLLLEGNSVTKIAVELNFSTSQYFAVVFRRYAGLAPTEWVRKKRKEMRQRKLKNKGFGS